MKEETLSKRLQKRRTKNSSEKSQKRQVHNKSENGEQKNKKIEIRPRHRLTQKGIQKEETKGP
mgnify:CR=1 FL=1